MYPLRFVRASGLATFLLGAVTVHAAPVPERAHFCAGCHGPGGVGDPRAGVPRLAGLPAPYLMRQLDAFVSGERKSPLMTPVAGLLAPEERGSLARYYAALPPAQDRPLPGGSGRRLAERGDPQRGLPPCNACHGSEAGPRAAETPSLLGQPARYLARQLRAWRLGHRGSERTGPMTGIARKLTDEEIESIAAYYAGGS